MTDRVGGFLVTLEKDMREDDALELVSAIAQFRGVLSVDRVLVDTTQQIATNRAVQELVEAITEMLRERRKGGC